MEIISYVMNTITVMSMFLALTLTAAFGRAEDTDWSQEKRAAELVGESRALEDMSQLPVAAGVPADIGEHLPFSRMKWSGLTGLIVGPQAFDLKNGVLKPFSSDGCSMSPDGIPGQISWVDCCIRHDIKYWLGGTESQRLEADKALRGCISDKASSFIASIYYLGVRAGGGPDQRMSYRWGYGWNYRRPYASLSEFETSQAEYLYGVGLIQLETAADRHQIPVVSSADKDDPSTNPLSEEEIRIYEHLRKSLKAGDVVVRAELIYSTAETKRFRVQLEKCSGSGLEYIFAKGAPDLFQVVGGAACRAE